MTAKIGWKIKANKKRRAVTIEVSPVLPPSATPDALSTNVVTVDVPSIAPAVVPIESAKRACLALGKLTYQPLKQLLQEFLLYRTSRRIGRQKELQTFQLIKLC